MEESADEDLEDVQVPRADEILLEEYESNPELEISEKGDEDSLDMELNDREQDIGDPNVCDDWDVCNLWKNGKEADLVNENLSEQPKEMNGMSYVDY